MNSSKEYYFELRDEGYTHDEAKEVIDKSDRTLYRYQADYNSDNLYIESNTEYLEDSDYNSEKELKLMIKRKELTELRKEVNLFITNEARKNIYEQIIKDSITKYKTCHFNIKKIKDLENIKNNQYIPDYIVTDGHLGINEERTDTDIIIERLKQTFYTIAKDIKKNKYKFIRIRCLADMLDGRIHMSQIINSTMTLVNQVLLAKDIFIEGLQYILDNTNVVIELSYIIDANHSQIRQGGKSNTDWADDNLEILVVEYIKQTFENNDRLTIRSAKEFEDVYFGKIHKFVHGYLKIKKPNKTRLQTKIINNNPHVDDIHCGHFHCREDFAIGYDIKNKYERRFHTYRSIVGHTDFGETIGYISSPGFTKIIITEKGVTTVEEFILD